MLRKAAEDLNNTGIIRYIAGYSPVGDIIVIALCIIMLVLLWQTYVHKSQKFRQLLGMLGSIGAASLCDLMFEQLLVSNDPVPLSVIYLFRLMHHILLTIVLYLYIQYLHEPLWIPDKVQKKYLTLSASMLIISVCIDVAGSFGRFGFFIYPDKTVHNGLNVFIILYALLCVTILYMIIKYRSRIIRPLFRGLLGVNIVSIWLLAVQGMHDQVSYTSVAYFFPIIGIVFMFHSNPFDIETGAVNGSFLRTELEDCLEKGGDFILMSCHMLGFSTKISTNNALKLEFYNFFRVNVKKGVLYHLGDDRFALLLIRHKGADHEKQIVHMLHSFARSYEKFGLDYKIVIIGSSSQVRSIDDYERIVDSTERSMSYNEAHRVGSADIKRFYDGSYILSQLDDIADKKDPDDPRVVVYCQPVFNLSTKRYDTAEALMRLELEQTGMVYPDQFIHIAEEHNKIHALSMIILSKTCAMIRDFMEEGLELRRISVIFSIIDLRYENFVDEVKAIIDRNGIPYSKIAVEITESRSDVDFNLMKERVTQLQALGIKFYLDDFGTGYSNFERIMEIPFDIIKFDRSMLIESTKSRSSKYMVSTFADMFNQLDYAVLFEGVENDSDERRCVGMKAKYLQGYKYSRPIPIGELRSFLQSVNS
ncbi:MAG: EAL domain-containing protein [Ruminococcus sp.]|nr:EAL domain-containing protein [Ruminococcus sp.]